MIINTRDFGPVDVSEQQLLTFVQPVYGFEALSDYILLTDDEIGEQFAWLQSVQQPEICFILVQINAVFPDYRPTVPAEVRQQLGFGPEEEIDCWGIAVIPAEFQNSTVNLKSPVLINQNTHRAAQIILEEDYPIRARLMAQDQEEG